MYHCVTISDGPQEFLFGDYSPGGLGDGSPQWGLGAKGSWDEVPQTLKQFADIVYRFCLQQRSKLENFTQFTS